MKIYYLITIYFVSYINYFAGNIISDGPSLLGCDVVSWGEQNLMC
jgi:hypothetical protein